MIELLNWHATFVFTMAAFGLAYVVGQSKLTLPIRERIGASKSQIVLFGLDLIECPACFGFWIGFVTGLICGFGWLALMSGLYVCATNLILWSLVNK